MSGVGGQKSQKLVNVVSERPPMVLNATSFNAKRYINIKNYFNIHSEIVVYFDDV